MDTKQMVQIDPTPSSIRDQDNLAITTITAINLFNKTMIKMNCMMIVPMKEVIVNIIRPIIIIIAATDKYLVTVCITFRAR